MVEAAELCEQRLHRRLIGEVEHAAFRTGRQRSQRLVDSFLPAGGDHHRGLFLGCRLSGCKADAGTTAQHHDTFSAKGHVSISFHCECRRFGHFLSVPPAHLYQCYDDEKSS